MYKGKHRKSLLVMLLFLGSILPALSASYTWTGSSSTNWNTASNWSPAGVPTSTDNVTIATASNAPALSGNVTVTNFTLQSGSIQLNGYTLNITGVGTFTTGTVGIGAINATGTATTFGGSSTGPVINASVNIVSGSIIFQYTTFNTTASFEKTGTSSDLSVGGNVFNGTTTIKYSVNNGGYLISAQSVKDIFNGDLILINTGAGNYGIMLAQQAAGTEFNGNITFTSTANGGIDFGQGRGTSTLATGKTISIGSQGWSSGLLQLSGFTQNGNTAVNLPLTGNSLLRVGPATTINGPLTATAGGILLNGITCNSTASLEKTGTSSDAGLGGNVFNGATTIKYSVNNGGYLISAQSVKDIFNGDLALINTATTNYGIMLAQQAAGTEFNGNITFTSTANGGIDFGQGGGTSTLATGKTISIGSQGWSSGLLQLSGFTQNGTAAVNLSMTGNSILTLGPATTLGGALTATAGSINLNGVTCNSTASLEKTGNSGDNGNGGNVFNGATTLKYSGSGGYLASARNTKDIFNGDLTLINTTTTNYGIFLAYVTAGTEFNGNITVNSTANGGIAIGQGGGKSTLATGKTISVGSQGFSAGTLQLSGITQNGTTAISLPLTGTSILTLGPATTFGGALTATAGGINLNGVTCNSTASLEKTNGSGEYGNGGNVFNGATTLKYSGSGGSSFFLTGRYTKDIFNGDLTLINTGSGGGWSFLLAFSSPGTEFNGNITVNSTGNSPMAIGQSGGTSTLATGKTISVGSQGFSAGTFQLSGITQNGSIAINLPMTGSSVLTLGPATTINGALTATAGGINLNGVTCNSTASLEKTNGSGEYGNGGNVFNGATTLKYSGSGGSSFFLTGRYTKDIFNGDLTLINTGSGGGWSFLLAFSSPGTEFNGNITVNSTGNSPMAIGQSGGTSTLATGKTIFVGSQGFSAGTLQLSSLIQNGTTAINLPMTGSSVLTLGPATTFGGALTATAGGINLNGVTCNSTASLEKTGNSGDVGNGGNVFNGATTIKFSSATGGYITSAQTTSDTFNGDLTVINTGISASGIYLARAGTANAFNGNISVSSTANSNILFGDTGGKSTLATGKTISVGSQGFSAGTLQLYGITQTGASEQILNLTGSAQLYIYKDNVFNGIVRFTAPNLYLDRSTFLNEAYFTKTGNNANACNGGNTFTKKVVINCTGTGALYMANSLDDVVVKQQ
ncbi:hypothetical protein [Xanthocytophaga agilis]|uniref:Autotransporter domain-containing protein n=1 Tax=Xanthocytophaga agilis TaxID=3048010 RepID=A0AAE3R5Q3_9BACT|nr:hypothetical protein [Xanthocytophaga agilis]MDJ1501172.1 hypothetical protein [Xanthocytophaga agilis]